MPKPLRFLGSLTLVVLACTDTPPVAPAAAGARFDLSGAPASSGQVLRLDSTFAWRVSDPESGLMAYLGRDIVAWCQGDPAAADTVFYHIVVNPVESRRVMANMTGDVHTSVWPVGPSNCARYLSETPLATGMSRLHYTDNDMRPADRPDPVNVDAWGYMAQGILTDAAGEPARFQLVFRATFDGIDPATTRQHVDIRLR